MTRGYVAMVDHARQIAADVAASLPRNDDASVAEQVEAQAGERVRSIAVEHDYDVDDLRALVERELARLLVSQS